MEKLECGAKQTKSKSANNNSVFESPKPDMADTKPDITNPEKTEDSKFTDGKRLESEEFENISISTVENITSCVIANDTSSFLEGAKGNDKEYGDAENVGNDVMEVFHSSIKRRGSSFDSLKFEMAHDAIEEEDLSDIIEGDHHVQLHSDSVKKGQLVVNVSDMDDEFVSEETRENERYLSRNLSTGAEIFDSKREPENANVMKREEMNKQKGIEGQIDQQDSVGGGPVSLQEHYEHTMEMRRRSESALAAGDKPSDNFRLAESCSHIAAVLFKVEAAVRMGYTTTACTDEPCKWNKDFVKKVRPDPISHIKFYNDIKVEKARNRKKKQKDNFDKASKTEQDRFLISLKGLKQRPVVLSCFDEHCENFRWKRKVKRNPKIPPSLRSLYNESNRSLNATELTEKCRQELENMRLTDDDIEYINQTTKTQHETIIWHEQRVGRITSSTVHTLTHTNEDSPAKSVMDLICKPKTHQIKTDAIKWGNEHESQALKAYKSLLLQTDKPHVNPKVEREGFRISKENPFIGVSTDSIMRCECHRPRIVEVKCPYSAREMNVDDFLKSPKCYLRNHQLKENHKYYSQVQLQMYVYNVDECDFIVWSPKFMILIFVKRNQTFIDNMILKSKQMYMSHILPELLTRNIESHSEVVKCAVPVNPENKLFCICQKPEDEEEYIGCDNPECPIEWYHLKCLKLKRKPKGQWMCKKCRRRKVASNKANMV